MEFVLVIRITDEGYLLIDNPNKDEILQELKERWDHLFEEARWGSIEHAMQMYGNLFEWIDQFGKKVSNYPYPADAVLPPRNLELDELKYLLGTAKR